MILQLVGEHSEWQGKYLAEAQSPVEEPTPGPTSPQEFGATDLGEVSLAASVEATQEEAGTASLPVNPTAQVIIQLLREIQSTQKHLGLAPNPVSPSSTMQMIMIR